MPVQYPAGILAEHRRMHAHEAAALFDVSHMGQLLLIGAGRRRRARGTLVPVDVVDLSV